MSEIDNFSHRAGYHADPLAVAMRQARKGGTLAAGEGALLVAEIERLQAALGYDQYSVGTAAITVLRAALGTTEDA